MAAGLVLQRVAFAGQCLDLRAQIGDLLVARGAGFCRLRHFGPAVFQQGRHRVQPRLQIQRRAVQPRHAPRAVGVVPFGQGLPQEPAARAPVADMGQPRRALVQRLGRFAQRDHVEPGQQIGPVQRREDRQRLARGFQHQQRTGLGRVGALGQGGGIAQRQILRQHRRARWLRFGAQAGKQLDQRGQGRAQAVQLGQGGGVKGARTGIARNDRLDHGDMIHAARRRAGLRRQFADRFDQHDPRRAGGGPIGQIRAISGADMHDPRRWQGQPRQERCDRYTHRAPRPDTTANSHRSGAVSR